MVDLAGKVAIVTGGSLGIGSSASISLANSGANVTIMDINESSGEEVVNTINSSGGSGHLILGDASSS